VNGVAKNATLVPVQVFTRCDDPTVCGRQKPPCLMYRNSDLMAALQWVYTTVLNQLDPGVRLAAVNLSLGGLQQDGSAYTSACDLQFGPLKTDIDLLRAVGVVTVAASGNDFFVTGIRAPACISTVAAVGSTTKQDVISEFSNMSSQVGLLAPGGLGRAALFCRSGADSIFNGNIRSSVSGPTADQNNLYDCYAGTSMAAPHVAGAFATIRTVCPDATVDRILAALFNTGLPIKDNRLWGGTVTARRIGVDQARQALGCASHDFNGDGKSDLLWRDANGNLSVWLMNGARATSQAGIGSATSTWAIVGQRDFDGDGKYDLLWRDTSGNNSIWFMNGTQVKSRAGVSMLPTTWSVVGTGDFDASGFGGILWRDTAGNNMIWLMDGKGVYASGSLGPVPTTFSVAGTGDFDGDGKCDILWRDASGTPSIWFMDGTKVRSSTGLINMPLNFAVIGTAISTVTAAPTSSGGTNPAGTLRFGS
jgi:hypothetical protein